MELQVQALTEQHGKEICKWSYAAPYDIYNWPSWGIMLAQELQFADPDIREAQFAAVIQMKKDSFDQELIGYVQYFPMEGVTRIGLGIKPDLCDQGIGHAFMRAILKEAMVRYPDQEIDLEVHTWNERAQKTYAKAGFIRTDEYERLTPTGVGRFYCMVYQG
ncbi:N-acetyltransferase [Paenibacillus psychroresistens]|uniref:N-acetyltransferase n=1 Tax=Paenibacillus psychroresistens TaxID=1778678 RepID=A0A6B8RUQ9_9BACL|nr:N-acetyltransferase [Paenibacillus psychroresistens]QGQ99365.1 N-acetyltransferase [Paenibacillus psychroresistens]